MRTRIVPYAPFGAAKAPLPDALETQIVTPLGELSTASVHYHRGGVNATVLDEVVELGFEYLNGSVWVEPPNCRFLSLKGSFDHLEQTPTRQYSLVGVGWMLRQAKVWAANGLPVDSDGKVQFLSANAGSIMGTLIQNAKGRGWGAGISFDFSAATDSAGRAWAKVLTIAYDLDLDLETILTNLYQQGVCDYRWEGRTLRIFNPGTVMARDLSGETSPVRLLVADGQTSAPEDWTNEDMLTDAMVLGEAGKRWEFTNGANSPLGRLEKVITQGGVSDQRTASLLAETDLLAGSQTRVSYTREFVLHPASSVWPFRDYQVGDWVSGQRGTGFERLRTASLSLTVNAEGVKGHAVLGDRLEDLLTKLAKRTKGITGGSSTGGSGVRPAPEGPDVRTPAAPSGLVVAADSYLDDAGIACGRIELDWAHTGKATNGTDMTIDRHQVFYRVNEPGTPWQQMTSAQETEIRYSPLPVFKADGKTAEQFAFKVRTVGQNGKPSAFSSVVAVQMEDDVTPPPVPQFLASNLSTWLRTVTVRWGGKGLSAATAVDMPRDFSHIRVHQGASPTGPWELVGSIGATHELWQSGTMPTETVWFGLTAVDHSGNESARSTVREITPKQLVDVAEIAASIDAGKVEIKNAGRLILESGQRLNEKLADADKALADTREALTGSGGVTERLEGAEKKLADVGSLTYATGQTLRQKLAATDTAVSKTAGDVETLKETTLPKLGSDLTAATGRLTSAEGQLTSAQADITAAGKGLDLLAERVSPLESGLGTLTKDTIPALQRSVDGKTAILRKTVSPTAADVEPAGTRWEVWSNLSGTGKLRETWRRTGSNTWAQDVLDPSYLPLVDIGAGTFGTLSGGRLEANTVTADKVLIGVGGNLYPDPDMLDVAGYAAGTGLGLFPVGSGKTGRGSLLIGASEAQLGSYYGLGLVNRRTPIVAGGQYLVSVWARGSGIPKNGAAIFVRFYKADGSYAWGTPSSVGNSEPILNNNWAEIKGTFTAPADTVSLVVGFYSQGSNPVAVRFSDPSVRQAAGGELIVEGTITGTHIDAESVGAKVGNFVKINVENITATATANLNSVVAQRIAAGTASFQTVDAKNLFVTGTASLDTVVAKRFAADTGKFLELGVEQLTVTASANLNEAVANKFFANIFASNKLTTNELMVGKGENLIPWLVNGPAASRTVDPHIGFGGTLNIDGGTTGLIGAHALITASSVVPGTNTSVIQLRPAYKAPNLPAGVFEVLPSTKYKVSVWVRAGGSYGTYPKIRLNVGLYDADAVYHAGPLVTPGAVISWSWQQIVLEFETKPTTSGAAVWIQMDQPGVVRIDQPSLTKDAASLIATGGIVADHITASEAMSAKVGQFLTLDVGKLTATGTSTLATAVIDNLWAKVVRSRSITTDMLLVGKGANLIPNGDLANGKEGWDSAFGLNAGDSAALKEGYPASIWLAGRQTRSSTEMFSVKAGVKYKFSMWARGNVTGKRFYVQLVTNSEADNLYLVQNQLTYTALTQYTAEFEVPTSATRARLTVYANHQNGTTSDGHQWFTGFELHEMNAASLIVTGGIVTEHLKITSSMTAALLKAKKVEAGEIDVNSLRADVAFMGSLRTGILTANSITSDLIGADAITSKHTLTGPLIRSAASGARTEMTKDGFRVLNASNAELVKMGYGISTGMSMRRPSTGVMEPLGNLVFGTETIQGSCRNYETPGSIKHVPIRAGTYGAIVYGRDMNGNYLTFTASSTSHLLMIDLFAFMQIEGDLANSGRWPALGEYTVAVRAVDAVTLAWPSQGREIDVSNRRFVPYHPIAQSGSGTSLTVANHLTIGREYRLYFRFDHANDYANSMLIPGDFTLVSIPL